MWDALRGCGRLARRLLVLLALAASLSIATYAVAMSPLGPPATALLRALPGAPQPPAARVARSTPVDGSASGLAAPGARPQAAANGPLAGGRGPSVARGAPELARHAAVLAATVAAFALGRRCRCWARRAIPSRRSIRSPARRA
jgi:hypothetical protein